MRAERQLSAFRLAPARGEMTQVAQRGVMRLAGASFADTRNAQPMPYDGSC